MHRCKDAHGVGAGPGPPPSDTHGRAHKSQRAAKQSFTSIDPPSCRAVPPSWSWRGVAWRGVALA